MNLHWGPVNIFEGVRIIIAIIDVFIVVFSIMNVSQGELIIPRVRRANVRLRRRIQMYGFLILTLVLGLQSVYVATIEEPEILTTSTITGSLAIIITLLVIFVLTAVHIIGWAYEGSIATTPLIPDSTEQVEIAVTIGRHIRHTASNALLVLSGPLELAVGDPTVPEYLQIQAQYSLDTIALLTKQLEDLSDQIKDLAPDVKTEF